MYPILRRFAIKISKPLHYWLFGCKFSNHWSLESDYTSCHSLIAFDRRQIHWRHAKLSSFMLCPIDSFLHVNKKFIEFLFVFYAAQVQKTRKKKEETRQMIRIFWFSLEFVHCRCSFRLFLSSSWQAWLNVGSLVHWTNDITKRQSEIQWIFSRAWIARFHRGFQRIRLSVVDRFFVLQFVAHCFHPDIENIGECNDNIDLLLLFHLYLKFRKITSKYIRIVIKM